MKDVMDLIWELDCDLDHGEHKCFRCNRIYDCYEPAGTTVDDNDCDYAYNEGVVKVDNGGGYWITECPNYVQIDTRPLYKQYMSSDIWRTKARKFIEKAGFKCQLCESAINLCVHHISYDHLCTEQNYPEDILVVCKKCHKQLHEKDILNNGVNEKYHGQIEMVR